MGSLTLELALWMILAFFIGCIIGGLLHGIVAAARARALAIAAAAAAPGPQQWTHAAVESSGTSAPAVAKPAAAGGPGPRPAPAKPAAVAESTAAPPHAPPPAPPPALVEKPGPVAAKPRPPQGLSAPPVGGGDKLQRISGIGPKLERTLHRLGVYRYDQIAAWTADEVEWVDEHLKFRGRIAREEWIAQARLLGTGDEEGFTRRFGSGGLKDKSGKSR